MRKLLSDSILDLGKRPNWKMHESESAKFLVQALPKVQNQIQMQFSHKVLKKIGAFWSIFKKRKKWISHCIFNSCVKGFQVILFKLGR